MNPISSEFDGNIWIASTGKLIRFKLDDLKSNVIYVFENDNTVACVPKSQFTESSTPIREVAQTTSNVSITRVRKLNIAIEEKHNKNGKKLIVQSCKSFVDDEAEECDEDEEFEDIGSDGSFIDDLEEDGENTEESDVESDLDEMEIVCDDNPSKSPAPDEDSIRLYDESRDGDPGPEHKVPDSSEDNDVVCNNLETKESTNPSDNEDSDEYVHASSDDDAGSDNGSDSDYVDETSQPDIMDESIAEDSVSKKKPSKPKPKQKSQKQIDIENELARAKKPTEKKPRFCLETAGGSVAPLVFVGEIEHAGKFGPWMVGGMEKFEKQGLIANEWQIDMLDRALQMYRGENIRFMSYGVNWWVYMGLGKTLPALAFIELTRRLPQPRLRYPCNIHDRLDFFERLGRLPELPKKYAKVGMTGNQELEELLLDENFIAKQEKRAHALVIVPKTTAKSWWDDITGYFTKDTFTMIDLISDDHYKKYKGNSRLSEEIKHTDIILINYDKLKKGIGKATKSGNDRAILQSMDLSKDILPIFDYTFNVVIMDEAHTVRNLSTMTARAIDLLKFHSSIVMTGTPIINNIDSMRALFHHARVRAPFVANSKQFDEAFTTWQTYQKETVTAEFMHNVMDEIRQKTVAVPGGSGNQLFSESIENIERFIMGDKFNGRDEFILNHKNIFNYLDDFLASFDQHVVFRECIEKCDCSSRPMDWTWDVDAMWKEYNNFCSGKYGENGKDMITKEKTFMPPKFNSLRPDHVVLNKQTRDPSGQSDIETLRIEILGLEEQIAFDNSMMRAVLENIIKAKRDEIAKKEASSKNSMEEVAEVWGEWWYIENTILHTVYSSRREIEKMLERKKKSDENGDGAFEPPLVFDTVTSVAYLWWKTLHDESFSRALMEAKHSHTKAWMKPPPLPDDPCERAAVDHIGSVMDRAVLRYGRSTLKARLLDTEIGKLKDKVNGRRLTQEEMEGIMDKVESMTGLRRHDISIPFESDEELKIYTAVTNQSIQVMENADLENMKGGSKFAFVFQMLMWLRQASIDARIIGRSASEIKEVMMMDQTDEDGLMKASKKEAIQKLDIESLAMAMTGISKRDLQRDNADFWIELRHKISSLDSHTKLDYLKNILSDKKKFPDGSKGLVFTFFQSFIPFIRKMIEGLFGPNSVVEIHGGVKDRRSCVDALRKDPNVRIMVLSLTSGNMGLNLQVANKVFLMDPWWNPQVENQAICRSNRIGQTDVVDVFSIIIKDTVEEHVQKVKLKKEALADAILGNMNKPYILPTAEEMKKNSSKMTTEEVLDILRISQNSSIRQKFAKKKVEKAAKRKNSTLQNPTTKKRNTSQAPIVI